MVRSLEVVLAPAVVLIGLVCATSVHAEHELRLTALGSNAVKVDGDLGDFRGVRFVEVGDDADGSLEYALGYDEHALYLGARVYDDELVRSDPPSPREDAVVLTFAMPRATGQAQVSEVWLFAGIPGKQAASASVAAPGERPRANRDVTVVEGPLARRAGYVLEARVPWSAIPGGREAAIGRGAIRLVDVDGKVGAKLQVVGSASTTPASAMPHLLMSNGPNLAVQSFFAARQLAPGAMRFDLTGQVAGDTRLDRVVVAGTFVIVAGPGIEERGGYHFMDLPVTGGAGVLTAELRELTGDGLLELVVQLRQQNDLGKRDLLQIIALSPGQPRPLFSLELRKETSAGSVESELQFASGRAPALEVRIGEAHGLDASNFAEQAPAGIEPILLPWGAVARRSYRWNGSAFAVVHEEPNPNATRPGRPAHAAAATATRRDDEPARTVHAEPPDMDELVAAFRDAASIGAEQRARFVQHANVAEDGRIESLMLFDKYLLVIGSGYRDGSGYFYYGLPVRHGSDVQRVFTADVTGDGRRELFVRHKQLVGDVQREILRVYTFVGDGIEAIAQIEVRRAQGEHSVGNAVDIVRSGRHWALRVAPGVAQGWGANSYPFVAESTDGYAPLLLPWKDRVQLYRFEQGRLVSRLAQ